MEEYKSEIEDKQELIEAISILMKELAGKTFFSKKKEVESTHETLFKAFERVVVLSGRCGQDEFICACKEYPILISFRDKQKE